MRATAPSFTPIGDFGPWISLTHIVNPVLQYAFCQKTANNSIRNEYTTDRAIAE